MDIQHQIPLFSGNAPAGGGSVYTVPDGTTYRITEIRYRNQGAAAVIFQMGVNGFEPEDLLVEPVSLAPAVGTAYRTYKESLWLGAGAALFVGGGAGVYVEVYGIIANVISGFFAKDGSLIGLRARESTQLEISRRGELHVVDNSVREVLDAMLVELRRIAMGTDEISGQKTE